MSYQPEPYDGNCPSCGHKFTLPDLKKMAMGDGWYRAIHVWGSDCIRMEDFDPNKMILEHTLEDKHGKFAIIRVKRWIGFNEYNPEWMELVEE